VPSANEKTKFDYEHPHITIAPLNATDVISTSGFGGDNLESDGWT
jgi:hypothetical protein